jgi:AcrR family transcriptional regulator
MIPNTFTHRGVPAVDPRSGPTPVSSPVSGECDGSAMRVHSVSVAIERLFRQDEFTRQYVGFRSGCLEIDVTYPVMVPRLWSDTIEAHHHAVRDATLDTTAALVARHGLRSVTMSQIAEETGIGRATLYKYFPDVEAILVAWHERQIAGHLEHLAEVREQARDPGRRLEAVLEAYAVISQKSREHHGTQLAALLHRGQHVARAQQQVRDMVRDLLTEAAQAGHVRDDVRPDELAGYCLHALTAASSLPSKAAVRRLVTLTLAGLRPPAD